MKLVGVILAVGLGVTAGAASANNLVANGDFSANFTGFSTQYHQVDPLPNALYPEGDITIAANPISVHNLWVDLGATTNPMLIVNGATLGGRTIWEEDGIATVAAGTYKFGATVMDICCNSSFGDNLQNSPSEIRFEINVNGGGWQYLAGYMTAPGLTAQSGDSGIAKSIGGAFAPPQPAAISISARSTARQPPVVMTSRSTASASPASPSRPPGP